MSIAYITKSIFNLHAARFLSVFRVKCSIHVPIETAPAQGLLVKLELIYWDVELSQNIHRVLFSFGNYD